MSEDKPPEENFADAPTSIAEVRSMKEQNASKWTPRDALVTLLREIDSGKTELTIAVIAYQYKTHDGGTRAGFLSAGGDNLADAVGTLEVAKIKMITGVQ